MLSSSFIKSRRLIFLCGLSFAADLRELSPSVFVWHIHNVPTAAIYSDTTWIYKIPICISSWVRRLRISQSPPAVSILKLWGHFRAVSGHRPAVIAFNNLFTYFYECRKQQRLIYSAANCCKTFKVCWKPELTSAEHRLSVSWSCPISTELLATQNVP